MLSVAGTKKIRRDSRLVLLLNRVKLLSNRGANTGSNAIEQVGPASTHQLLLTTFVAEPFSTFVAEPFSVPRGVVGNDRTEEECA